MTCQARTSYTEDEILWGYRFEPCMWLEKGAFRVDYSRFELTFEVQTPAASAKEMQEMAELQRQGRDVNVPVPVPVPVPGLGWTPPPL